MAVALFILLVLMMMMIFDIVVDVLSIETSKDVFDVVVVLGDDGDVVMYVSSKVLEGGVVYCCRMYVWTGWITVLGSNPL